MEAAPAVARRGGSASNRQSPGRARMDGAGRREAHTPEKTHCAQTVP